MHACVCVCVRCCELCVVVGVGGWVCVSSCVQVSEKTSYDLFSSPDLFALPCCPDLLAFSCWPGFLALPCILSWLCVVSACVCACAFACAYACAFTYAYLCVRMDISLVRLHVHKVSLSNALGVYFFKIWFYFFSFFFFTF